MDVASEIQKLRMTAVRRAPFYGDILVSLSFTEDRSVPTAVTDGAVVRYNPDFLGNMSEGERNYIIMHEVMHVLLRHPQRGKNRRADIWNAAADYIVNSILDWDVRPVMRKVDIPFERPADGLFAEVDGSTVRLYKVENGHFCGYHETREFESPEKAVEWVVKDTNAKLVMSGEQ